MPARLCVGVSAGFLTACVTATLPWRGARSSTAVVRFPAGQLARWRRRRRWHVRLAAEASDDEATGEDDGEEFNFDLVNQLIQKSRGSTELGITAADWHKELYDEIPEGYAAALEGGIDFVDVVEGVTAMKLLRDAETESSPRFCLRLRPRPTFGLGLILNKALVHWFSVLGPLEANCKRLGVSDVHTLTLHSNGGGRLSFPFWVYDAVAEAYRRGLCMRVGVSHPNASAKAVAKVAEELQRRGVGLNCVFVRLSLLDRRKLALAEECRKMGLQVIATDALGRDELASGRYTAANPTGGEISVPRFTLSQLMPLRPLHEALATVAQRARQRCEKQIETTTVALQWVCSKGANPLCDVSTDVNAKALVACKDWTLTPQEVELLDRAADEVGKAGRR